MSCCEAFERRGVRHYALTITVMTLGRIAIRPYVVIEGNTK